MLYEDVEMAPSGVLWKEMFMICFQSSILSQIVASEYALGKSFVTFICVRRFWFGDLARQCAS
jgi:hypothetical protein